MNSTRTLDYMKKAVLILCSAIAISLITAPWLVYSYSLSLLDTLPSKPQHAIVTDSQLSQQWAAAEKFVAKNKVGKITPYWNYTWLFAAISNNVLSNKHIDPYTRISAMASEIAIHHMKATNVKTDSTFRWHMLHANLSIWLQRNWEAKEILVKYKNL